MNKIEKHFDQVAENYDHGKKKYDYYYFSLKNLLKDLIGIKKDVFELGCGTGDLLFYLKPKKGYGQDISSAMIGIANNKYKGNKNLHFSTVWPDEKYNYIFMSDVIEHLEYPLKEFKHIWKIMDKKSKFIITMANPLWEPLLMIWEKLGWKMKEGPHYRMKNDELRIMTKKAGLKIVEHDYKLLIPVKIPLVTEFANRYFEKYLKPLSFIEYFVLKKA